MVLCLFVAVACGNDDADPDLDAGGGPATTASDDGGDGDEDDDDGGSAGDGQGKLAGDLVTIRLINLLGHSEGGTDAEVMGPGEDFQPAVYDEVAYGEIIEVEFPKQWDVQLRRLDNGEVASGHTAFDDTPPGQVVVYSDGGATELGGEPEDRVDGWTTVGVVSAIHDPDNPATAFVPTDDTGTCLYGVNPGPSPDGYPTNYATIADGGDSSGIAPLTLVGDRVYLAEPGTILVAWSYMDEDAASQDDDCSRRAFEAEVEGEDGKAVFVAFYGDVDDVQHTVYNE